MKKCLIFCLIFFSCFFSKAFHYFGSEITCKQVNGLTYQLTFKLYGDIYSGWSWGNSVSLTVKSNSFTPEFIVSAIITDTVKLHTGAYYLNYSAIVTFPTMDTYTIYYSGCCRTWSINAIGSDAQTYYNHTVIMVDTISGNSTPEFLYDPIVLAPAFDTLYYNPLPYDADGDILLWSIDTPRMYDNEALLNYLTPSSSFGGNFSINPKTGEIKWIPVTVGYYLTAIKVEEFRNGIKIGEIIRDMLFIVEPKGGNITRANIDTDTWSTDIYNNFIFYLTYNVPFNLLFDTQDPDANTLSLEAKGYPFLLSSNPATFSSNPGLGYVSSTFSWTPTLADINIDPYLVVYRIYEHAVTDSVLRDKTILLMVGNFTMVEENLSSTAIGNIYPNPSTGELFIQVNVEKASELKFNILNESGQEVKSIDKKLNSGQNLLYLNNLNLPSGIYFINIKIDDDHVSNNYLRKKIVIK